jgi:hypothetical protein
MPLPNYLFGFFSYEYPKHPTNIPQTYHKHTTNNIPQTYQTYHKKNQHTTYQHTTNIPTYHKHTTNIPQTYQHTKHTTPAHKQTTIKFENGKKGETSSEREVKRRVTGVVRGINGTPGFLLNKETEYPFEREERGGAREQRL